MPHHDALGSYASPGLHGAPGQDSSLGLNGSPDSELAAILPEITGPAGQFRLQLVHASGPGRPERVGRARPRAVPLVGG